MLSFTCFAHSLIRINASTTAPKQGDAISLKITSAKPIKSASIKLGKTSFKLFKHQGSNQTFISYIGISRYSKAARRKIHFSFSFMDGSRYQTFLPIYVKDANFKKEHIKLTPKKSKIQRDKPSRTNENQLIGKKFRVVSSKKSFDGAFIWPVKGRITSEFGTQRVYNNRPGWMHSGIDISGNTGTPIAATQHGTVILAKKLRVHGNTVMIDHGLGIISIYNHLDQIQTQPKAIVKTGDIIGTVGSTGVATGSHLHFGISIQSIRVNPRTWLENH